MRSESNKIMLYGITTWLEAHFNQWNRSRHYTTTRKRDGKKNIHTANIWTYVTTGSTANWLGNGVTMCNAKSTITTTIEAITNRIISSKQSGKGMENCSIFVLYLKYERYTNKTEGYNNQIEVNRRRKHHAHSWIRH